MVLVLLVPVAAAAKAIDGRVSAAAPAKATARNPRLEGENEGCSPLWSLQVDVMWPSWLRLLNSRQHSREPGLNAATPSCFGGSREGRLIRCGSGYRSGGLLHRLVVQLGLRTGRAAHVPVAHVRGQLAACASPLPEGSPGESLAEATCPATGSRHAANAVVEHLWENEGEITMLGSHAAAVSLSLIHISEPTRPY